MVNTCLLAMALLATLSAACSVSTPAPIEYRLSAQMPTPNLAQAHASPENQETFVARVSQTLGVPILGLPTTTGDRQTSRVSPTATPRPPLAATSVSSTPFPTDHFRDSLYTISFEIPHGWQVATYDSELYPDPARSFGIRPSDWQQPVENSDVLLDEYPILVVLLRSSFHEGARLGQFTLREGAWYIEGRGIEEAQLIRDGDRLILRGEAWYAVYTKENVSYAGLNTVTRALLNEGGVPSVIVHSIYMPIGGPISLADAFELVVRTIEMPRTDD